VARTVIETVPVSMTYEEYRVWEELARKFKMTVPEVILRFASVGVRAYSDRSLMEELGY
jgi:hypothetical protein